MNKFIELKQVEIAGIAGGGYYTNCALTGALVAGTILVNTVFANSALRHVDCCAVPGYTTEKVALPSTHDILIRTFGTPIILGAGIVLDMVLEKIYNSWQEVI
jgi:hypothetical protein